MNVKIAQQTKSTKQNMERTKKNKKWLIEFTSDELAELRKVVSESNDPKTSTKHAGIMMSLHHDLDRYTGNSKYDLYYDLSEKERQLTIILKDVIKQIGIDAQVKTLLQDAIYLIIEQKRILKKQLPEYI